MMQKILSVLLCFLLFSCSQKNEKRVTIYTSLPERDLQKLIASFNQKHPDIRVSYFYSDTGILLSKLNAEFMVDNPKADIVCLSDDIVMMGLKQQGKLLTLDHIDTGLLSPDSYDPQKTFFGTTLLGVGIVCHQDFKVSSLSWKLLTDPTMMEKLVMPSPMFSGTASVNLSVLAQHKDFGWSFWDKMFLNKPLFVKGNGAVLDTVIKKGRSCGIILDFLALNAIKNGATLRFFYPQEGVPVIREPIAVLKASKNIENAKIFVEFMLSREGQKKMVEMGYRSVRTDVENPVEFKKNGDLNILPIDPEVIMNRLDADKVKFGKSAL